MKIYFIAVKWLRDEKLFDKLNNRKRKGEKCQIRANGDKLLMARFCLETRGGKSESWQPFKHLSSFKYDFQIRYL